MICLLMIFNQSLNADDSFLSPGKNTTDVDAARQFSMEITVQGKPAPHPLSIDETPAFITTIELDERGARYQDLPELLENCAGIQIKSMGGIGQLSTVSLRGSSTSQVLVLLNGVRLNAATGGGADLAAIPSQNIERIEILRGADSAVYGDGAFAGVINIITRQVNISRYDFMNSSTIGSFGTWLNYVEYDSSWKGTEIRASGYYNRSRGDFRFINDNGTEFYTGDDYTDTRRNNDTTSYGLFLSWTRPMNSYQLLSGHLETQISDRGIPGIITFPSEHARQQDRRLSGHIHYENMMFSDIIHELVVDLTGRYSTLKFEDPLGEQMGVPVDTSQSDSLSGIRMKMMRRLGSHSISLTTDISSENFDDDSYGRFMRTTLSEIARIQAEFMDDAMIISGIARYETISGFGDQLTPKIGIQYRIKSHTSIKCNAGSGFRTPSFNELYMNQGFMAGNPDLKAENSISYDAGAEWEYPSFRFKTSVFQMESRDLIQYVLISGFRYKPMNIGKVRSRGIEAEYTARILKSLSLTGSYTFLEAIDRTDDPTVRNKQIPGRPENQVYSKLNWDDERFTAFVDWTYMSRNSITLSNTKWLPARTVWNAGAGYRLNRHVLVGFEIKNLSDQNLVDIRGFPLPPRSYQGTIKVFW